MSVKYNESDFLIPKDTNTKQSSFKTGGSSKTVTINVPQSSSERSSDTKVKKPSSKKPSNKGGIAVALFITFLASVCFSIVLPSIWPYLQSMHASKSFLGWAVAVNSAGSFIASPVFGAWSDKRTTKEVLACTLVVMVAGNIMYSLAGQSVWLLLAGRFIVGVAAANYAVAQTYISYATTPENRTVVMALNSAANVFGFIIGPSFALVLALIKPFEVAGIKVNELTTPGYLSAIMSIFGIISLVFLKEIPSATKQKMKQQVSQKGSMVYGTLSSSGKYVGVGSGKYVASGVGGGSIKDVSSFFKQATGKKDKIPWFPVIVCLYAYFAYTTAFTTFETIGTPYTLNNYHWNVEKNGIMFAALGGICILSLVILQVLTRFANDRVLLVISTLCSNAGFAILMDWRHMKSYIPLYRFWPGIAFCAAGYAASVAVLFSIYSKVLENLDQGMLMGWLSSVGSIARIIGPVFASYMFQYAGDHAIFYIFVTIQGGLLIMDFCGLAFYKVLAPRIVEEDESLRP